MNEQLPDILKAPVTKLAGVAEKTAQRLQKIGIYSVFDLLLHLPIRYEDKTQCCDITALTPNNEHLIFARIVQCQEQHRGRKKQLKLLLEDDSGGQCYVFIYHIRSSIIASIQRANYIQCYGKAQPSRFGMTFLHPQYQLFSEAAAFTPAKYLTPIYSLSQGLQQQRLRNLINGLIASLTETTLQELIPENLRQNMGLCTLSKALMTLHNPTVKDRMSGLLAQARKSLAFEELLAHQLGLRQLRQQTKAYEAPSFKPKSALVEQLILSLEFKLTNAQQRVIDEIKADCCQPNAAPMMRLIQGDVGCGKTIVAAIIALHCIEQGWQCAIMAPTELLAMQHFRSFQLWFAPLDIEAVSLTSKTKQKTHCLERISEGHAQIIIGTQALIQERVQFQNLGLCIIDEQHRFGVHQRLLLRNKGQKPPHQLIMTATPIPRSLAMTFYADLDLSTIDELPALRQPVQTVALPDSKRADVILRVGELCQQGQQAYWVCPLIEEEETPELALRSAEKTLEELRTHLPHLTVILIHGKMPPSDKLAIMQNFKDGEIDLLVATTVIEVGIDVPNATLIVIENADRLGLAQLHQLRGRVGRGSQKSYCVLVYGQTLGAKGKERLALLRKSNNGFEIAKKDLKMRGPGEFLGVKQSGTLNFRVAQLELDQALLPRAQETADYLLYRHPEQAHALIQRWMDQSLGYKHV